MIKKHKLWRYNLEYALEVALSDSELSKIQNLANELKGQTIEDSLWNILQWEEKNVKYDTYKASLPAPEIRYYKKGNIITDIEIIKGFNNIHQTPYETISRGKGVCKDYAILTAGLLLAMNYSPVYILNLKFKNDIRGHVATAVMISNEYFVLDQHLPIWDLGRYYYSWLKKDKYIDHIIVYMVTRGKHLANVKKIRILSADEIKSTAYIIKQSDIRNLKDSLSEQFQNRLHLLKDYNLIDLDKSTYLPFGYSYGAT